MWRRNVNVFSSGSNSCTVVGWSNFCVVVIGQRGEKLSYVFNTLHGVTFQMTVTFTVKTVLVMADRNHRE
jgi:hypothetical protein